MPPYLSIAHSVVTSKKKSTIESKKTELNTSLKNVRNRRGDLESNLKKIGIIGGGCYGTALAQCFSRVADKVLVAEKNSAIVRAVNEQHENSVSLPGIRLNDNIFYTQDDSDISNSEVVFIVVPANFVSSACGQARKFSGPIVLCSKGFDLENKRMLSDLVAEQLSNDLFFLSGPSFAAEIARNLPAKVNLAGVDFEECSKLAENLSSENFKIEPIPDMIGLQVAAALKNVLAIGCGILHGRNLGQSAVARFMVKGIQEMRQIAEFLGGYAKTFDKVGALGDIILTCTSLQSRNMSFGKFLAEGGSLETWDKALAEGIFSSKFIADLKYPGKVLYRIYQVIHGQISVESFLNAVFE